MRWITAKLKIPLLIFISNYTLMRTLYILVALIFTFNVSAQNLIGKKKDLEAIQDQAANLSAYFVDGDAEAVASIYVRNGKIFPPGKEVIKNRLNIEAYYTPDPSKGKLIRHKIIPTEIIIEKREVAYDHGYYEGARLNADNEEVEFRGKYIVVWKQINKEWMIYLDMWNGIRKEE